ncbi:hypothetical protein AVEN_142247-1 [Araneus ventricosus]|uniref:Uncharacterized protein n=1 Tax=Araneus ventricosus TaxID=182803 RepID=A0A4Y2FK46_ARAVE|nr:hypothetical protein AVEN_142247-1 [Araneus ventricosus]
MKLFEVQSLLDMSLLNVAVSVCNGFEKFSPSKISKMKWLHDHWEACRKCRAKIVEIISRLRVPIKLENKLASLIKHVYSEMIIWAGGLLQMHSKILPQDKPACPCLDLIDFRRSFQWKSVGIINEKETVLHLVSDERLDVAFRFVLACHFCLEKVVISLWGIMPEVTKSDIRLHTATQLEFVPFWITRLKEGVFSQYISSELGAFIRLEQAVFDYIALNVSALDYITHLFRDRKHYLYMVACGSENPKVIRFCLRKTSEEYWKAIFDNNPKGVLLSLIDWPWQKHFMQFAPRVISFLGVPEFYCVMHRILQKIQRLHHDFDYVELLKEFWECSPTRFKESWRTAYKDEIDLLKDILKDDYQFLGFH